MFCHVCGAEIEEGNVFCTECGASLKIVPPSFDGIKPRSLGDDKNPAFCPRCGLAYGAEMAACPRCGMQNFAFSQSQGASGTGFEKYAREAYRGPVGDRFDKYAHAAPRMTHDGDRFRHDFDKYPAQKSARSGGLRLGFIVVAAIVIIAVAVVVWRVL